MGRPLRSHWRAKPVGLLVHVPFEQVSGLPTTAVPEIAGAPCVAGMLGTMVVLRLTRCGLLAALLLISSVALLLPSEPERTLTPIEQVPPGPRNTVDGEQRSLTRWKSPAWEPVMRASGPIVAEPLLVRITVWLELVVFTVTLLKFSDVGLTDAPGGCWSRTVMFALPLLLAAMSMLPSLLKSSVVTSKVPLPAGVVPLFVYLVPLPWLSRTVTPPGLLLLATTRSPWSSKSTSSMAIPSGDAPALKLAGEALLVNPPAPLPMSTNTPEPRPIEF